MDNATIVGILAGVLGLLTGCASVGAACWYRLRVQAHAGQEALTTLDARLRSQEKHHNEEIRRLHQAYRSQVRQVETADAARCDADRRERWFSTLRKEPWRKGAPEVEVEAKFVFQLLHFLGYEEEDMELRTSVPVREGSKQTTLQVDWVVRDALGQALMAIEVKAPDTHIDDRVREQARSYTFRLGAPVYMITNGLELQIYHLGVVQDSLVLSCRTAELRDEWDAVVNVASEANVTALRQALGYHRAEGRMSGV